MDIVTQFKYESKIIKNNVENGLYKILICATEDSYDLQNVNKLLNSFENLNFNSYGSLKFFVTYLYNCSKFYECPNCKKFAREIYCIIDKFLSDYENLLS